jgi:hypothetical protein
MSETGEGPTSPWISFKVLFGVIQDNISSVARELLFHHYEELRVCIPQKFGGWVGIVCDLYGGNGIFMFSFFYLTGKQNNSWRNGEEDDYNSWRENTFRSIEENSLLRKFLVPGQY